MKESNFIVHLLKSPAKHTNEEKKKWIFKVWLCGSLLKCHFLPFFARYCFIRQHTGNWEMLNLHTHSPSPYKLGILNSIFFPHVWCQLLRSNVNYVFAKKSVQLLLSLEKKVRERKKICEEVSEGRVENIEIYNLTRF